MWIASGAFYYNKCKNVPFKERVLRWSCGLWLLFYCRDERSTMLRNDDKFSFLWGYFSRKLSYSMLKLGFNRKTRSGSSCGVLYVSVIVLVMNMTLAM